MLLPPAIRLFGAYTLVDATYGSTVALASPLADNVVTPGSRFPLSPRHRGSLGAEVERAAGRTLLGAGLTARGVSSSYLRGDEANRMAPLAGYVVADLRLSARRDRLAITIVADNILDRRYSVYGVYAENPKGPYGGPAPAEAQIERFFTPAYPRTVHVSVAIEP
jgi:outer membrane receptor protein involved in Fe transport